MKIDVIDKWEDFKTLKEEWTELLCRSEANTVFLAWEWADAWRKVFGELVSPWIVCVRERNNSLVGLAPFYRKKYLLLNRIPVNILRVIGDHGSGGEYQSWIISKGREVEAGRLILDFFLSQKKYWDCIWFPYLPGWTRVSDNIFKICVEHKIYCKKRSVDFSFIPLPDSLHAFKRNLSKNQNLRFKRSGIKLSTLGGIRVRRCVTREDIPYFLKALFSLHTRRWRKKGDAGAFSRVPGMKHFYEHFAVTALENGWLRLFALEHQGEIRAVQIGYVYNNVFHQMQEGFDPDHVSGTGNILRLKIVELCISEGNVEYDFLGGLSDHKKRWGAVARTGYSLFIGNRKIKTGLIFAPGFWPTGRFLKEELFFANRLMETGSK